MVRKKSASSGLPSIDDSRSVRIPPMPTQVVTGREVRIAIQSVGIQTAALTPGRDLTSRRIAQKAKPRQKRIARRAMEKSIAIDQQPVQQFRAEQLVYRHGVIAGAARVFRHDL